MRLKSTKLYKRLVITYLSLRSNLWSFGAMCAHVCIGNNRDRKTLLAKIADSFFSLLGVRIAKIITHNKYLLLKADNSKLYPIRTKRIGYVVPQVYDINEEPIEHTNLMDDLYLIRYQNVTIHGGSDVICDFDKNLVVCDYAYKLNETIVACSSNVIKKQYHKTALVRINEYGEDIDKGILLNATFSNNYYHILYDIVVKLQVVDVLDIPLNVPLIVDKSILRIKQFKEVLDIMNTSNRKVIWIDEDKYYRIGLSYFISPIHNVPQQVINQYKLELSDFSFDKDILVKFREKILKLQSKDTFPKRIFISRKGHIRRQYNEDELLGIANKYGFEVVHPESLSFVQQVSLFNQADIIIGATGAAFANVLFMKEGAYAICFVGEKVDIPVFTIGASIAQSHLLYIAGQFNKFDTSLHSFQRGFTIPPSVLNNILSHLID